jgi:hypothetical protein
MLWPTPMHMAGNGAAPTRTESSRAAGLVEAETRSGRVDAAHAERTIQQYPRVGFLDEQVRMAKLGDPHSPNYIHDSGGPGQ